MRILIVLGTRPEAIKLLPLYKECVRQGHTPKIYFTAQHEDMVDPVLKMFGLSRSDCLIPEPLTDRCLSRILTHFISSISAEILDRSYDAVVVQGDTTTALAGALAAAYAQVPVVHIEAGLRSFNRHSPFPEEINRCAVAAFADLHFAPTRGAAQNLIREGVSEESIHVVGNTGIDTLHMIRRDLDHEDLKCSERVTSVLAHAGDRDIILITGHRRENQEHNIGAICREISQISRELSANCVFVYVTHPSPNVQKSVDTNLETHDACLKIPALNYVDFVKLMSESRMIITDSGGIQEEAPSFGTFVIVTRDSTERSESIDLGYSKLVCNSMPDLREAISVELEASRKLRDWENPYGDGKSSEKIVTRIASILTKVES